MTQTPTPYDQPPTQTRRSSGRTVAVVVSVVGAVILIAFIGIAVLQTLVRGGSSDTSSYSVAVGNVTEISIDVSAAELTTTFADVDEASLEVTGQDAGDWELEVRGGELRVRQNDRWWGFDIGWIGGWDPARAELVLPTELEGALDADLDVSAGGIDFTGDARAVSIDISAGSVTFDGASTELEIDISAGDADVTTSGPQAVSIEVSAGRLVAEVTGQAPASTEVDVSAGSVTLTLPDEAYAVTGDASAGTRDIEVRTDPSSRYELDVQVSAGDARVGY